MAIFDNMNQTFNARFSEKLNIGGSGANGKDGKDGKDGASAYELAVKNGFEGTEVEWLESLKGKDADVPDAVLYSPQTLTTEQKEQVRENIGVEKQPPSKIGEVTLLASAWVGENNLHSQVVTSEGITPNSQVDLTPSVEQLVVFYEKDLTFVTENEDGVVTVYVIGQKPENDYTIQVTITEVANE